MTRDGMAAFLERLGHRVVHEAGVYWYDQRRRFMAAFPHAEPFTLDHRAERRAFRATGAIGLRHLAPLDAPGRLSYAFIVDDPAYDLETLSANTRSKVRRGLKHHAIRRVEADEVRHGGRDANEDTLARMHFTRDVYDWHRYWDAVAASPGAEVWAAFEGAAIVAYLVSLHVEGCAELHVERSHSRALRHYPNNALVFSAVQDFIRRRDVTRVLFGFESVDTVSGVDRFKDSMAFRRWPVRQHIALHPLAEGALRRPWVRGALRRLIDRRRESEFWRKVEGTLIFHGSLAGRSEAEQEPAWTS
jgi:hypothetical protein